jgi:hypothetical protein
MGKIRVIREFDHFISIPFSGEFGQGQNGPALILAPVPEVAG